MRRKSNLHQTDQFLLRMTREDREILRSRALTAGVSQTHYVNELIRNGVVVVIDDVMPLLLDLRAQGASLHHLASHIDQIDCIDPMLIDQAINSCINAQTDIVDYLLKWDADVQKEVI